MIKKFLLWIFIFLVLLSSVSAVATAPNSSFTENYYKFDDSTDETGNYDLTVDGATSGGTGIISNAYSYDGTNDYLYTTDTTILSTGDKTFTVSFWFNLNNNDVQSNDLFGFGQTTQDTLFALRLNYNALGTNDVVFRGTQAGTVDTVQWTGTNYYNTGWHHAVIVANTSILEAFIDGSSVGSTSLTDGFPSYNRFTVGQGWYINTGVRPFSGLIDEFTVADAVYSSDEIEYLYNSGSPTSEQQYPFSSGFVYPYSVTDIVFSPSTVYPVDSVGAVVSLNDSVGADVRYYWLVNDVNITSGTVTTSSGNDFTIPSLSSSNYGSSDTIKLDVFAVYESNNSQASDSYFETISTTNVSITSLSISPSTVYTNTDVSGSVTFDYGDSVVAFYEWIVNDVVITSNYYSTTGSTYSIPSFSSSNFVQGDNVTLNVTPFKGSSEAIGLESSVYKIVTNRDPFFYNAFAVPSNIVEDTGFDFACYFGDSDSDTLSIDWTLYRNDVEYDSSNDTATDFGSGVQGIVTSVAGVDSVEGDEWYIDCQAFDSFGGNTVVESSSVYTVEAILNWSVTVQNTFDDSFISDFWVYVTSIDGSYNYNYTTNTGSIITDILRTNTSYFNVSVGATDYLSEIPYFTNIQLSSNGLLQLDPSRISFDIFDLFGDEIILTGSDISYVISDYGTINDNSYAPLDSGDYIVNTTATGYFPVYNFSFNVNSLDIKTVDITGFYDSVVTFSPVNTNNDSLNVFNGWLSNADGSYNVSFSSNNGSASVPYLNDTTFYYKVSVDGYASETGSSVTNNTYFNFTTTHYTFNSVRINIYNDTSDNLLTQPVIIVGIFDDDSLVNSTNNGTIIIDFLTPEDYELRFNSSGFVNTTVFISVTNDSTQEVNIHMISSSGLELQRFLVVDDISEAVSSAIVRLQEQVPGVDGLWVTVDEKSTNSDGYAGFYVTKSTNTFYRMIVIYDGDVKLISDATLFLPGIDEVITLQISTLSDGADDLFDSVVKSFVWSGSDNETFTFSWVDPNNFISGARLEVWVEDLNISGVPPQLYLTNSSVLTTGSLSVTLPVVNDTIFTIKAYIVYSSFDELVYTDTRVFGSTSLPDKELGLILSLIVFLFVAFITISLKPLFSSVLSFSVLGIMSAFHLIVLPVTIITSFVALAIIFFVKIKGGGN